MTTLSTDTLFRASPAKLNSGEWGCRIDGRTHSHIIHKGDVVEVKIATKAGKTWQQVSKVIWTDGKGTALLAKASANDASRQTRRPSGSRSSRSLKCYSCHARFEAEPIDDCCPRCGDYDSIS